MIGGAGLALMAWKLAVFRTTGRMQAFGHLPMPRSHLPTLRTLGPTREYYRIIDNATWAFRTHNADGSTPVRL